VCQSIETTALGILSRLAAGQAGTGPLDRELTVARAELRQLPTVYFCLLNLHYIRGFSIAEVTQRCGCPEAAVIRWHHQAVRAYALQLETAGLIPSLAPKGGNRSRCTPRTADENQLEMFSTDQFGEVATTGPAVDFARILLSKP